MKAIISLFFVALSMAGYSQTAQPKEKSYPVVLTLNQWQNALTGLDSASRLLISSPMPTNQVVSVNQKLAILMQAMQVQIGQAIQAEQKADSLKSKNPKPKEDH